MKKYLYLIVGLFVFSCQNPKPLFVKWDVKKAGIDFHNQLTPTDDFNILDYLYFYNGGGVAVGDINGDDLPDIFFSGNQVANKLYLNKGNLQFQDISQKAGVEGQSQWNTGAVMLDINADGWLDIYVCAVVGIRGMKGRNELFINNGDNTFTEKAAEYGLDFDTFSSNISFFDYDLDGDLDLYLLNHAIHTQESYGNVKIREKRNLEMGDKLLRNDDGKFVDVSEEAGIYGGPNGYGLAMAILDFNLDHYPDIYIGNDFHEDDYFYINNGDGTFTESLKKYFGHTSQFSMGNDVADINGDGYLDIISLDMLPEDESILKKSQGDIDYNIQRLRKERFGYHYQYSRNMLYLNNGDKPMSEVAFQSDVAATDWSWSALFADYNQDGNVDLFVSNGIPKRPNDLDFIKYASDEEIQNKLSQTKLVDQKALNMMPSGAVRNYIFKGTGDAQFTNMSDLWLKDEPDFSAASALADLDNDGDLDIVVNKIDSEPTLYINQNPEKNNFLKITCKGSDKNTFGIGTKIWVYSQGKKYFKEMYSVRGFQSSSEPMLHFGLGKNASVDSIVVLWNDKKKQTLKNIKSNQTLTVSYSDASKSKNRALQNKTETLFRKVENNLGIRYLHKEDRYVDFDRQHLIPYFISDRGPATALGDMNGDLKPDLFFGSSKFFPPQVYLQTDRGFEYTKMPLLESDSINEEVEAIFFDTNQNDSQELLVATGGGDFFNRSVPLLNCIYDFNKKNKETLITSYENTSIIKPADFDNDNKVELFVGNYAISNDFGAIPQSYLLEYDNNTWNVNNESGFQNLGMVRDVIWTDYNNDNTTDLIVVGEWMAPHFYKNVNNRLVLDTKLEDLFGLWQCIAPFDIDSDGDWDFVLGNWGNNSKFKATKQNPMLMYYGDIDGNGSTETIIAIEKKGKYYPLENFDALAKQLLHLKKKYTSYQSFAGKTLQQIFTDEELKKCKILKINELKSGYLENNDGNFQFIPFDDRLQTAPILDILVHDFDKDGKKEALLSGNYFGLKPFHGRLDAFPGALVRNPNHIEMGHQIGLDFLNKSTRQLHILPFQNQDYLLVTYNQDSAEVYKINSSTFEKK